MLSSRKWIGMLLMVAMLVVCATPTPLQGSAHSFAPDAVVNTLLDATQGALDTTTRSSAPGIPDAAQSSALDRSASVAAQSGSSAATSGSALAPDSSSSAGATAGQPHTLKGEWPWGYPTAPSSEPNSLYIDIMGFFHVANYDAATYTPYPIASGSPDSDGHVCVWVPRSWHGEPDCLNPAQHIYDCTSGGVCGWFTGVEIDSVPHDYTIWRTITEPTYTSPGLRGRFCRFCGWVHDLEEPIPQLDQPPCTHVWGDWQVAILGEGGIYGPSWNYQVCQLCGKEGNWNEGEYIHPPPTPPCEHVWGEWITNPSGNVRAQLCQVCGEYGNHEPILPPE